MPHFNHHSGHFLRYHWSFVICYRSLFYIYLVIISISSSLDSLGLMILCSSNFQTFSMIHSVCSYVRPIACQQDNYWFSITLHPTPTTKSSIEHYIYIFYSSSIVETIKVKLQFLLLLCRLFKLLHIS